MKQKPFMDAQVIPNPEAGRERVSVFGLCLDHGMDSAIFYNWRTSMEA